MPHCIRIVLILLLMVSTAIPAPAASDDWVAHAVALDYRVGFQFGVKPWGSTDGYDYPGDGYVGDLTHWTGVAVAPHHGSGAGWAGPTGFYYADYRSAIPWGGSKTWEDIYLWARDYSPPGAQATVGIGGYPGYGAPPEYVARLVLDYVPASLNWTGPTEFYFNLSQGSRFTLPVPTVTDPLEGVRMHLTVYAIPEPSSLAGLGLAVAGLCGALARRNRR